MTIEDAIEHAGLVADNCEGECSEDHRQLSEWLRELKRLREERDEMRTNEMLAILGQDTLKTTIDQLRAENDELRELVRNLWDAALHPQTFGDGSYLRGELEKLGIEVD